MDKKETFAETIKRVNLELSKIGTEKSWHFEKEVFDECVIIRRVWD